MKQETKFKQTEIGLIPVDWESKYLEELGIIKTGQSVQVKFGGYPIIGANGIIGYTDNFLEKGSLIYTGRVGTIGSINFIKDKSIWLSDNVLYFKTTDINFLKYIYYYLKRIDLSYLNVGSTQPLIKQSDLKRIKVFYPKVKSEVVLISKILSDLDSKIELNQQMNKTLEEIGKTLFKRWFVDFEFPNEQGKPYKSSGGEMVYNEELKKEIPKEWDVKLLKDLVLLNKRGIPPKYVSGGIPVLNQRCVRDKIIFNDASIQYHDPKKIINSELYLKSFDILINSMGVGTLGRISQASVVNDKYLVHSCITIIRADPQKISPFLLGYYFKDIQSMIEDLGEGSTGQTSLDNKKLDNLLVVVPDKKIQDKLDVLFNSIILEIGELDYENIKLAETRDLLLPKLMSGKIRVKYEK